MQRIVFCGPFCTGKTSLRDKFAKEHQIPKLVDDVTRPMRPHERQGDPYNFISDGEFQARLERGQYFEAVTYHGYQYGVPKIELEKEKWTLDILSSSWKYYTHIPGIIGIYLEPPSEDELVRRARARGDSEERIKQRLASLQYEDSCLFSYRISPQPSLEDTYNLIQSIIFK